MIKRVTLNSALTGQMILGETTRTHTLGLPLVSWTVYAGLSNVTITTAGRR